MKYCAGDSCLDRGDVWDVYESGWAGTIGSLVWTVYFRVGILNILGCESNTSVRCIFLEVLPTP